MRRGLGGSWTGAVAAVLWWEPFWIALLAPAILLPGRFWVTALQPLWVLLLFALWPLRLAGGRHTWRRTRLDLPLGALLAATAAALAMSPAPASSWEAGGYLLLGVAAAAALVQWPPLQAQPAYAAFLLLALGLAAALAGGLLPAAGSDKLGIGLVFPPATPWAAALGESINPNVLGGALLIPLLLSTALAVGPRWSPGPSQAAWGLAALALAGELLLTQCRGALLAAAVGAAVIALLRWPRGAWVVALLGALGAGALLAAGGIALAFDALGGSTPAAHAGQGLADRLVIWQAAAAAIRTQPLTGLGLGLFGPFVTQHGLLAELDAWQPHAHNLPLQVAADLGLGGLLAYSAVIWGTGAMLVTLLRARPAYQRVRRNPGARGAAGREHARSEEPQRRLPATAVYRRRLEWTLAVGSAAALAAILVHGLVDAALWGNKAAVLPWLLVALVCLLYGAQASPAPSDAPPPSPRTKDNDRT
jgi:O-antigen ligase